MTAVEIIEHVRKTGPVETSRKGGLSFMSECERHGLTCEVYMVFHKNRCTIYKDKPEVKP